MPNRNVSLDIETLDTKPTAVVLSIGAVHFDAGGVSTERFHAVLTRHQEEQTVRGRTIDAGTVAWWAEQSLAARAIFNLDHINQIHPLDALADLARFLGGRSTNVWGFGSDFDNVIVSSLYQSFGGWQGKDQSWSYKGNRCLRTLLALVPESIVVDDPTLVKHNALDDAIYQAHLILGCYAKLNIMERL